MPPAHACDACKRRKVKCDGVDPCANCRISRLICGYRATSTRPRRNRALAAAMTAATSLAAVTPESDVDAIYADASASPAPQHPQQTPLDIPRNDHGQGLGHDFGHAQQPLLQPVPQSVPQPLLQQHKESAIPVLMSPAAGGSVSPFAFLYHPGQIHTALATQIAALLTPSESMADVTRGCIDFFIQYIFPNTPVAHEPTLREGAALLSPASLPVFASVASSLPSSVSFAHHEIACLRKFTLVTALCAFVASVNPGSLAPASRIALSRPFLLASRAMLNVYEEYDLEHPDATSLAVRIWHSAALQNTTGRVGASYQYHAEAAFLAQRLRLFDERALQRFPPTEAQLLRAMFWLLYLADNTAVALETRPPLLDKRLFQGAFTVREMGDKNDDDGDAATPPPPPLLDDSNKVNQGSLESRLFVGFRLKRRIWSASAELLADIRAFARHKNEEQQDTVPDADQEERTVVRLAEDYLSFVSLADELPSWLRNPESGCESPDKDVVAYQRICFWTQRSNIMTVFHCMRLVILQKCLEAKLPEIMGLNDRAFSWATRKIEIVRDFLYELQVVPFVCFQVQGETAVERIRRVGSILLELIHNGENKTIEKIVRTQFAQLLDLLAQLDSKASDELAVD